jgi:hypothetical protein
MLWQFLREHRRHGRGFCSIEPGDLSDDFLADCARYILDTGDRGILKKIHFVELSPLQLVRYDPFRFLLPKHIHPELRESFYRSWQHTKVQSFAEIYQWKQGQSTDFEGMPRLQRLFINVLTGISTEVDDQRLSIGDAQVLIDLGHPRHYQVWDRIQPHLSREIVADFETLHSFKSIRDLRQETESFLNRIRSTHGPLFKEMLSGTGNDPVIDLHKIVQQGDFLLVKTGKSLYASNDQNVALASMFIHDIIEVVLVTAREERRPFSLFIDEAHKYVRPGIGDIARTARKYKLALFFATTDLVSLKKGDLDLAPELLSVVNTVFAFRMTWPDDLKKIVEFVYAQDIDFTELEHEVERRAGPEWLQVKEWSESYSRQKGRANTNAVTVSEGTKSEEADGDSTQGSDSTSYLPDGQRTGAVRASGHSKSHSKSHGKTASTGSQTGTTENESEGYGVTVNHKLVHLERIVRELQATGMLKQSVPDQIAKYSQQISGQSKRQATVRVRNGKAVHIETAEVPDPFLSPEAQARAVEWIKRQLYQTHDYYFTPSLDPADEDRRIREFLSGGDTDRVPPRHNVAPRSARVACRVPAKDIVAKDRAPESDAHSGYNERRIPPTPPPEDDPMP